ncbi:efflux RND transporter periplasmic adaptor subunit [bacterium]|nr:efflux RND transporter periplasmic adaptor subunit [bacterium]
MKKISKHWIMAGTILIMAVIIGQILSQQKEPMKRRPASDLIKPPVIKTVVHQNVSLEIEMTGPLYAYHRADIYAEVSGVLQVTDPPFRAGLFFEAGQVLLKIDDGVFRNNVLAQRSALMNQITLLLPDLQIDFPNSAVIWQDYLSGYDIHQNLGPLPEASSDQERYYIASRNIYQQYYTIKSMEATLEKYTIRAPFPGIIATTEVNPGTLIRTGQKLGELAGTGLYEMEASVTLDEAEQLRTGQPVKMTSEDMPGEFRGTIQRINSVLDRASMTVKVYIHSRDQRLRDGMYMSATAQGSAIPDVVRLKRDLLVGNQVYVVRDSVLTLHPVTVVSEKGEYVLVRGLTDGMQLLFEVWPEARPGIRLPAAPDAGKPDYSDTGKGDRS